MKMRAAILTTLVLLLLVGVVVSPRALAQEAISDQALAQIGALMQEKASWSAAERKMDSHLIMESRRGRGRALTPGVPEFRSRPRTDDSGRALIDITGTVSQDVLDAITQLGGEIIASVPRFDSVRAAVPFESLETLAAHTDIRSIRRADGFMTNMINVSEGVVAHRADDAQLDFGVDGSGVSIGVLSDGVDSLLSLQVSGDLPSGVTVLPGQGGGGSEGTAMLEIVFDMAPASNLFFATAFNGQASFAQNILTLQSLGCQVIVDDIFYFFEPVFQDGVIAQAVEAVAASGVSYFSSAGNAGNFNDGTSGVYEGDFTGINVNLPPSVAVEAHDFGAGNHGNVITGDSPFVYTLHWADPNEGSGNDYDLYLLDPTMTTIWDASVSVQDGNDFPVEGIDSSFFNDTNGRLVVVKASGDDRFFHLNTLRGRLGTATDGQTAGHSTTDNGFGVAAVYVGSAGGAGGEFDGSESVESFSSDGPRRIFYEADGTPITPGNFSSTGGKILQKPDITAADGVSTATPGFNPFFGTSAAAPHAAAMAALLIEDGIFTTPEQVRDALLDTAFDIEAPGFDRDSGAGIANIYGALNIDCSFVLSSPSELVPADGVVNAVVSFTSSCPWTAATNSPFITLVGPTAGFGDSVVAYTVAPNNGAGRIGTIIIGGESFEITQRACAIPASVIDPVSQAGCLGGAVVFNALGSGTGPLGIQWQVDEGIGFRDLVDEHSSNLIVENITQNMNGYRYQAVFFNNCGNMATTPAVLTVGQPGTPSSVGASDGLYPDRVRVQWSAVPGATSYRVFRSAQASGSGAIDLSGPITTLQFDDFTAMTGPGSGCTPTEVGIVYQYFVIATNPCGDGVRSPLDAGSIADPAKISASLRPDKAGDFALLLLTFAAMYAFQRRRKAMHASVEKA